MSLQLKIDEGDMRKAFKLLEDTGANMEKVTPRIISDVTTEAYRKAREIQRAENIRRTGLYMHPTSNIMKLDPPDKPHTGIVGNTARDPKTHFPYPIVIEQGSKPHVITPRVKKALAFIAKGGDQVIVKRVQHPGTKPRRVFGRARDYAAAQIEKLVEKFLREKFKR